MATVFIRMMLKVFGGKSPIFLCMSIATLSIEFFVVVVFGSQTDYSLILYYKGKS